MAILNLGNLGGSDVPNHKCKYSNGFPIVKKGKIDIKFVFVSHLAPKLWLNPVIVLLYVLLLSYSLIHSDKNSPGTLNNVAHSLHITHGGN